MDEQAPAHDPDRDEAGTEEPTYGSAAPEPPVSGWPRTGDPDSKAIRETATAVFQRAPVPSVPAAADPPDWLIEDTEEHETIEPEPANEPARPQPQPQSRAQAQDGPQPRPPRRTSRWGGSRIIAVAILVGLSAAGLLSIALRYNSGPLSSAPTGAEARPASTFPKPAGARPSPVPSPGPSRPGGPSASAPLDDLRDREFDLVTGTSATAVRSADLGDRLFVATTPADGNALPSALVEGSRIRLQLVPSGRQGPASVEIRLNSRVRWHVRLTGGAAEHRIDMTTGRLSGIDINGGAARIELSLPSADGTTPIRMTGGVNEFLVHLPAGVPARVRVQSGAISVNIDARNRSSIAPGTVFTPLGWDGAADRYDVDAVAEFATLRIDHDLIAVMR